MTMTDDTDSTLPHIEGEINGGFNFITRHHRIEFNRLDDDTILFNIIDTTSDIEISLKLSTDDFRLLLTLMTDRLD
jgi:hypothetical protein